MSPVAIVIAAIGILCTILIALLAAAWRVGTKQQKGNDLLGLLQDTMHRSTQVINSISRRVMALEFVIGQRFADDLAIAQQAVKDEDSAVHWMIGPKEKDNE